jgi:hypothetical protein
MTQAGEAGWWCLASVGDEVYMERRQIGGGTSG